MFISLLITGMENPRAAAREAVEALGYEPVLLLESDLTALLNMGLYSWRLSHWSYIAVMSALQCSPQSYAADIKQGGNFVGCFVAVLD